MKKVTLMEIFALVAKAVYPGGDPFITGSRVMSTLHDPLDVLATDADVDIVVRNTPDTYRQLKGAIEGFKRDSQTAYKDMQSFSGKLLGADVNILVAFTDDEYADWCVATGVIVGRPPVGKFLVNDKRNRILLFEDIRVMLARYRDDCRCGQGAAIPVAPEEDEELPF